MATRCVHDMIQETCGACNGSLTTSGNQGVERRRGNDNSRTKQEVCRSIARRFSVPEVPMSTGSTEPAELFDSILRKLGLPVTGSKPDKARAICAQFNVAWPSVGDATATKSGGGGTVTLDGLLAVERAAKLWSESQ